MDLTQRGQNFSQAARRAKDGVISLPPSLELEALMSQAQILDRFLDDLNFSLNLAFSDTTRELVFHSFFNFAPKAEAQHCLGNCSAISV